MANGPSFFCGVENHPNYRNKQRAYLLRVRYGLNDMCPSLFLSDYLLPVCLMDFKSRRKIGVIFFSSSNQSKQAQMMLSLPVSILSELEYGRQVVHAALVLQINSIYIYIHIYITGQRRTESTAVLRPLVQIDRLGTVCY